MPSMACTSASSWSCVAMVCASTSTQAAEEVFDSVGHLRGGQLTRHLLTQNGLQCLALVGNGQFGDRLLRGLQLGLRTQFNEVLYLVQGLFELNGLRAVFWASS